MMDSCDDTPAELHLLSGAAGTERASSVMKQVQLRGLSSAWYRALQRIKRLDRLKIIS